MVQRRLTHPGAVRLTDCPVFEQDYARIENLGLPEFVALQLSLPKDGIASSIAAGQRKYHQTQPVNKAGDH